MKSDIQIQKDVMEELQWQPFLSDSAIGVAVKNGIVTLSGQVDSYSKKIAAERAAKSVAGVKAIAEDIQVGVSPADHKTDAELAAAVLSVLKWHSAIQQDRIKIKVEDGNLKLEGEVEWEYQRENIKRAVEDLSGIRSVINLIPVKPGITASGIQQKISAAFHRSATIDARKIAIDIIGDRITLRGKVRSFAEKEDAQAAAWSAPGVISVNNWLVVEQPEYAFEHEERHS